MENSSKVFRGAGYLTGFIIAAVIAIIFVAITGINALIGAIAASIAFPLGIFLEKRFQGQESGLNPKNKKIEIGLLILGFVIFALLYFKIYII